MTTTFALMALSASASAQALDGRYKVEGTNLDGSAYEGTADIATAADGGCSITWKIADAVQKGTCTEKAGALSATYSLEGQAGTVDYEVRPDGHLDGKWRLKGEKGVGTEVLTLVKAAASPDASPSAVDFVRSFYMSDPIYNPGVDEPFEAKLTGPALAAVKKNEEESIKQEGIYCIDFVLSVNAQDYDEPTVRRTLKVSEVGKPKGDRATVDASFVSFELEGVPADKQTRTDVRYDLQKVEGAWRVSDISAKAADDASFGWRLSEMCR